VHVNQLMDTEYGPSPHPAPTAPLPPIPGAPRIPYTTPQEVHNRHSSYELLEKLRALERQQKEEEKKKRHSAPSLNYENGIGYDAIRRSASDNATVGRYELKSGKRRRPSFSGTLERKFANVF
jgi:hypothetical protein